MGIRRLKNRVADYWCGGLGFDLGTVNTLVYARGKGIIVNQPSYVAFRNGNRPKQLVAIGNEAKEMLGRTPKQVDVIAPIQDGVISNFRVAQMMLQHLVHKSYGNHFFKSYGILCVPSGASETERRAIQEVAELSDLKPTFFIEEVMAAALGAGIDVASSRGSMVVDIGGGTTDVAVIALGGVVVGRSNRTAGNAFDQAIIDYAKERHDLHIGQQTAEQIKFTVGSTKPDKSRKSVVRGRNFQNGMPKEVEMSEEDIFEAIWPSINELVVMIRKVLESTPPELAADIYDTGITLVGGGALLRGFDITLSEETGVPVAVAEDPLTCAAQGVGKIISNFSQYRELLTVPDSDGI